MSDGVFERYDPATGTTTIFVPRPAPAAPLAAPAPTAPMPPVAPAAPVAPVAPAPAAPVMLPAGYARIDTVVHEHYARLPDGHLLPILPPGAQPLGAYGSIGASAPAAPVMRDVTPPAQHAGVAAQLPAPVGVPQHAPHRPTGLGMRHGILLGLVLLFVLPIIPGTRWLPDVQLWALRSLFAQTIPLPYPSGLASRAVMPLAPGDPDELTYRHAPTITASAFCAQLAVVQSPAQAECQTIYADLVLRGTEPALTLAEMDVQTGSGTRGAGRLPPDGGRNLFLLEPATCDGVPPCPLVRYDSYRAGVWAWTSAMWVHGTRTLTESTTERPCTPAARQPQAQCVSSVVQQMTLTVRRIRAGGAAEAAGTGTAAAAPLVAGDLTVQVQDIARTTDATTLTMQLVNTGAQPRTLDPATLFTLTTAEQPYAPPAGTPFTVAAGAGQAYILTTPIGATVPFTLTVTTQTGRAEERYAASTP